LFIIEVKSDDDLSAVKGVLGILAAIPCIIHVNSLYYNRLKAIKGVQNARADIKKVNSHNDKLGFNWSVLKKRWESTI
jgi:hypothetical protein